MITIDPAALEQLQKVQAKLADMTTMAATLELQRNDALNRSVHESALARQKEDTLRLQVRDLQSKLATATAKLDEMIQTAAAGRAVVDAEPAAA